MEECESESYRKMSPYLYNGVIIMCRVHEESVSDRRSHYLAVRLDEGADWLAAIAVDQSALFMSVPG